jgi:hypothetical protein
MDEEEPNEKPIDNITDVMTKSMMGTSANALDYVLLSWITASASECRWTQDVVA